ncbi:MAG: MerR family transcriptional regulator [Gemmatimonadetes bacterium]|nr:MerR family transcriptional regulator [Gemmatimonadota bacterium]
MENLNIGQVARRAGIPASAIRYYEESGLLPQPARQSGWRRYGPEVLQQLLVIRTARELGFGVEEIRVLLHGFPSDTAPPARWRKLAAEKLPAIEAVIRRATAMKRMLQIGLSCRCVQIEDCFTEDCAGVVQEVRGDRKALPVMQ